LIKSTLSLLFIGSSFLRLKRRARVMNAFMKSLLYCHFAVRELMRKLPERILFAYLEQQTGIDRIAVLTDTSKHE
jgi:hypothetical protein